MAINNPYRPLWMMLTMLVQHLPEVHPITITQMFEQKTSNQIFITERKNFKIKT